MDEKQKLNIIENLIENRFDKNNFSEFISNVLNVTVRNGKESVAIKTKYKSYIESYQIYGNYEDSNSQRVYIMAVKIKESLDPTRARVKQREIVAEMLRDYRKDAALVAFYSESEPYWRIAFIKLEYLFTIKGIDKQLTPAKRLSYIVGEGEASHTVKSQFMTLKDLKLEVTLKELEELFKLEKVTNEFFKEYKNKYLDIRENLIKDINFMNEAKTHEIENPENFAEGFAKKLMGQLAFLYFLQKKGWLGIEIVPQKLSYGEYDKIYSRALNEEKIILEKIYDRIEKDLFYLNKEELKKIDNKTESELLVRPFYNTKYFKEWGNGDKKFIRNLFKKHEEEDKFNGKTFFEDYLEPLFYNNFSEERGEIQYSAEFNSRIPFLNGGLFDPYGDYNWKKTKFNLRDSLFSNDKKTGILDLFDIYNFTINENDSYETEVAVDPEMLGKVFENLLDISDRKSKGAFYTPREIVYHMTNESIMNYLLSNLKEKNISKEDLEYLFTLGEFTKEYDQQIFEKDYIIDKKPLSKDIFGMPRNIITYSKEIDELLSRVKIADPACGSGAFPLGILNEIVRARNILTFYINLIEVLKEKDEQNYWKRIEKKQRSRKPYTLKLYTIQNCLYGVDIEPSAIDIAKLRLWLSILVDCDNDNVKPLPNLDFNFMIGNSLVDEFERIKLFDYSLLDDHILEAELKKEKKLKQTSLFYDGGENDHILKDIFSKQAEFFNEKNTLKKRHLKKEIENFENHLIEVTLNSSGNIKKLEEIKKGRNERRKPYFIWRLEFAKVFKENGGFDIIIGNPPYVGEGKNKDIFKPIQNSSFGDKYYVGKMDFWYFFTSLGIELLNNNGCLSYIAPNNWLTTSGGKKMRNHIMKETVIKEFIDFGDYMVFENADQQTMIFLLEKNHTINQIKINYSKLLSKNISNLKDFLNKIDFPIFSYYSTNINRLEYKENSSLQLLENSNEKIINKMKEKENIIYLNDDEIAQGIVPNPDVIGKRNIIKLSEETILNNKIKIGDGVFVVDKNFFSNLNDDEKKVLKPLYESENIKRYYFNNKNNKKLIYINGPIEEHKYPTIIKHLSIFKKIMEERRENQKGSRQFYNVHWGRDEKFFDVGEKILSVRKCPENPIFSYTTDRAYVMLSFNVIKTNRVNMKYLIGILNSKLITFWLKYMGKMQGSNYQVDKEPLMNIPIKITTNINELKIITIVNQIIELKGLAKDSLELEKEIDEIVYEIYGLSEEERELIRKF